MSDEEQGSLGFFAAWVGPDEEFSFEEHARVDVAPGDILSFEFRQSLIEVPTVSMTVRGTSALSFSFHDPQWMYFGWSGRLWTRQTITSVTDLGNRECQITWTACKDPDRAKKVLAIKLRDGFAGIYGRFPLAPSDPRTYYHPLFQSEDNVAEDAEIDAIDADEVLEGYPFWLGWEPTTGEPRLRHMMGGDHGFHVYEHGADIEVGEPLVPLDGTWSWQDNERPYRRAKVRVVCEFEQRIEVRCELYGYLNGLVADSDLGHGFQPHAAEGTALPALPFCTTWDASSILTTLPRAGREISGGWVWEETRWTHEAYLWRPRIKTPDLDGEGGAQKDVIKKSGSLSFVLHYISGTFWRALLTYNQPRREEFDVYVSAAMDERWMSGDPDAVLDCGEISIADPTKPVGYGVWESQPEPAYEDGDRRVYDQYVWICEDAGRANLQLTFDATERDDFGEEVVVWTRASIDETPVKAEASYLGGIHGGLAVGHAVERCKRALAEASYAKKVTFEIAFDPDLGRYTPGLRCVVLHPGIPGGRITGLLTDTVVSKTETEGWKLSLTVAIPVGAPGTPDAFYDTHNPDGLTALHMTTSRTGWRYPGGVEPSARMPLDVLHLSNPANAVEQFEISGQATINGHPDFSEYLAADDDAKDADEQEEEDEDQPDEAGGVTGSSPSGAFSMSLSLREPPQYDAAKLRVRIDCTPIPILGGFEPPED